MENKQRKSAVMRGWFLRSILLLFDAAVVNIAYLLAIFLRFSDAYSLADQGTKYIHMFKTFAPWYTVICMIVFVLFRLYSGVWRYAGVNDVKKLIIISIGTCMVYVIGTLLIVGRMPISVYILGACIQFVMISIPRLAPRYVIEYYGGSRNSKNDGIIIPLMLVGVCENARIIQNMIEKDNSNIVKPVCVLENSLGYSGKSFNGLPVICGKNAASEAVTIYGIRSVIIADNKLPKDFLESVYRVCAEHDIELRGFVIGTEYRSKHVEVRNLLRAVDGPIRIVEDGEDDIHFDGGRDALKSITRDCSVESIAALDNEILLKIRHSESSDYESNDEWIKQYREETGNDISFF